MPKTKKEAKTEELTPETPIEVSNPLLDEVEPGEKSVKYRVERSIEGDSPSARMLPRVIGGVCEHCGNGVYKRPSSDKPMQMVESYMFDPQTQEGRCEHYKGLQLRCSYCPQSSDWKGNIISRTHTVYEYPVGSGVLIIHCNSMECEQAHLDRFIQRRKI